VYIFMVGSMVEVRGDEQRVYVSCEFVRRDEEQE
jgi:hypothetical protein